jgi:hypothetical protein
MLTHGSIGELRPNRVCQHRVALDLVAQVYVKLSRPIKWRHAIRTLAQMSYSASQSDKAADDPVAVFPS